MTMKRPLVIIAFFASVLLCSSVAFAAFAANTIDATDTFCRSMGDAKRLQSPHPESKVNDETPKVRSPSSDSNQTKTTLPAHEQQMVESSIVPVHNESLAFDKNSSQVTECINTPAVASILSTTDSRNDILISRQIEWVEALGGLINPKQAFRHEDPLDPSSLFGVFASDDIEEGEILTAIPNECILEDESWTLCNTTNLVVGELAKGNSSLFAPFVASLQDTLDRHSGQLFSSWSPAGKELLETLLGDGVLPPKKPFRYQRQWEKCDCQDDDCALRRDVAHLLFTHGEDLSLVPLSEKYNHNKRLASAKLVFPKKGPFGLKVKATRDIQEGEQIYLDYRHGGSYNSPKYGTPELLRDFGFIEPMPQRWTFHKQEIGFDIDVKQDGSGDLQVTWLQEYHGKDAQVSDEALEFLVEELHRLEKLDSAIKTFMASPSEQDTIRQYRDSMMVAIRHALADASAESFSEKIHVKEHDTRRQSIFL